MKKLKHGWVEGSAQDFLDLSDADMEYIQTRLALSRKFREIRAKRHLTQMAVADRLKTSQSRIAKMEKGDPSVSIDLLVLSLYKLGLKGRNVFVA